MMPRDVVERDVALPSGTFHCLAAAPPGRDDAPLVLLLHGFPDHPRSFGPVMARLVEAGYRVAAPWMRGYHPSVLHGPYDLERLALDVIELARTLSPDRPVYAVGHDWGAAALYGALVDAPAHFTAAVTLAVPHPQVFLRRLLRFPGQVGRSWYMFFFQVPGMPERVMRRRDFALIDRLWRLWSPGFVLPEDDRAALHDCLQVSMPAPVAYYRALTRPPSKLLARVRAPVRPIAVPLLYLHGTRDGCISARLSEGQDEYFTGPYERMLVQAAGHFLQLEAPDPVASHIIDWFQEFPTPG
ncbi:alpha/beta fold hydrolase [Haliangium sp.]|uniref:alpha/beta fold hydrolase n=1 Tax=Haliangium sp. TaxID=2663208 RepID=UPI003D0BBB0E